jgi:hypothetical protein
MFENYTYLQIFVITIIVLLLGVFSFNNMNNALIQVIISLIILLLMGYIGYNIYLIELQNMFKGENDLRKEVNILNGTYDFSNNESKFNTIDKTVINFKDIRPSTKQDGGAEYSYNFWIYIDQEKLRNIRHSEDKDIILFLKGEKNLYYNNKTNYNCGNIKTSQNPVIITKNPLVRLSGDGSRIVIEYNNIYTSDSFQNDSKYNDSEDACKNVVMNDWNNRNKNMLGIYNIEFNNKWFMVTIVMKEVSDRDNVLSQNRASCKMYINGVKLLDRKVETRYINIKHSATLKNNSSPFYINPLLSENVVKPNKNPYNRVTEENALKMSDIKYFNYAINEEMITSLYNKGFNSEIATIDTKLTKNMVTVDDMEYNKIKEL